MAALQTGLPIEILSLLIEAGADVNASDKVRRRENSLATRQALFY